MTSDTPQAVMVTGAGRSIGRAVAERFHAAGARVHICCLTSESLEDVLGANPGMSGSIADVGSAAAVARWFGEGLEALGTIDVLVNNAGISGPRAPVEEIEDEDWYRVIDVNLNGMFHCIKPRGAGDEGEGRRRDHQRLDRIHPGWGCRSGPPTSPPSAPWTAMTRKPGARARALRHPLQRRPARNHRQPARPPPDHEPRGRAGTDGGGRARALRELHLHALADFLRGGRRRRVLPGAGRGPQHHGTTDRGLRQPGMGGITTSCGTAPARRPSRRPPPARHPRRPPPARPRARPASPAPWHRLSLASPPPGPPAPQRRTAGRT